MLVGQAGGTNLLSRVFEDQLTLLRTQILPYWASQNDENAGSVC